MNQTSIRKPYPALLLLIALVVVLIGVAGLSNSVSAATIDAAGPGVTAAVPQSRPNTPMACPSPATAGLDDTVERTDFCVFYDQADTSATLAGEVADYTEDHWDRYVDDFGFLAPSEPNKLKVEVWDNSGCNGGTGSSLDYLYVYNGCDPPAEQMDQTVGHELFHRIQYKYDPDSKWMREGTARAMQDQVFDYIDTWAGSLGMSFSFNSEVNDYLAWPNFDLTTPPGYPSALWWKYYMEQYGSITTEPQRGVDAMVELWQATTSADDIGAINLALSNLGAGVSFDEAFRQFVVANWTKDLSGVPDGSYNYIDEDQTGNPAPYGPLVPANGGTISTSTSATWNNQSINRYGAAYYRATPGANCPVVSATFHRDSGAGNFYHIITDAGGAFQEHKSGSGTDWAQSFLKGSMTRIVAIAGGTSNSAQVDVNLSCANPVIDIKMPNTGAPAHVGPAAGAGKFLVQLLVTNGSPTAPVVAGLSYTDFSVQVGSANAIVVGGGYIQEQYWLLVQAPAQAANGQYDLTVTLNTGGTPPSDSETDAVQYDADNTDQVLVIDRSYSMVGEPLEAAQDAAALYVDITRNNDGLSVVPYNHDASPPAFAMQTVNPAVRTSAKTYIDGLTAAGATSIGDGLAEAVDQRTDSTTGNPRCSFVLLSDGMENSSQYWSDVQGSVVATGCPVSTIAFGPASNETLMQQIATATGGSYYYNDVYVSVPARPEAISPEEAGLDLSSVYEYAQTEQSRQQRLLQERGLVHGKHMTETHKVMIDESIAEVRFTVDWYEHWSELELQLQRPDGTWIRPSRLNPYDFVDYDAGHLGWVISDPMPGEWTMLVIYRGGEFGEIHYQVLVSGRSPVGLFLLLPAVQEVRYTTGMKVPINAIFAGQQPLSGTVFSLITAPDGRQTRLQLFDDGQHGDGNPGDGLYGNFYTLVNQALEVQQTGEPAEDPPPVDEGGYRVRLFAQAGDYQREGLGSFAVFEGDDDNNNGLPDVFEETYDLDDPNGDPDLDSQSSPLSFTSLDEYYYGTDPTNSDTDGGGESDSSEVQFGRDPFDPADDQIEAPDFLQVEAGNGEVILHYDVKPAYTLMRLFRAPSVDGPWTPHVISLPLTGHYTDTQVTNGNTYFYRLEGHNGSGFRTRIIGAKDAGDAVEPREDPYPPYGNVLINDGAPSTSSLQVTLSFAPELEEMELFEDITHVMISNNPYFTGASWQPFQETLPWTLDGPRGELDHVYVRFRDDANNVSPTTAEDSIFVEELETLYLPIIIKQ